MKFHRFKKFSNQLYSNDHRLRTNFTTLKKVWSNIKKNLKYWTNKTILTFILSHNLHCLLSSLVCRCDSQLARHSQVFAVLCNLLAIVFIRW